MALSWRRLPFLQAVEGNGQSSNYLGVSIVGNKWMATYSPGNQRKIYICISDLPEQSATSYDRYAIADK